jgi:hypothetical protein
VATLALDASRVVTGSTDSTGAGAPNVEGIAAMAARPAKIAESFMVNEVRGFGWCCLFECGGWSDGSRVQGGFSRVCGRKEKVRKEAGGR